MASVSVRVLLICAIVMLCLALVHSKKGRGRKGQQKPARRQKAIKGARRECVRVCQDNNGNEYERSDGRSEAGKCPATGANVRLTRSCYFKWCQGDAGKRIIKQHCMRTRFKRGCRRAK